MEFSRAVGNHRASPDRIATARTSTFLDRLKAEGWSADAMASIAPFPDLLASAKARQQFVLLSFADYKIPEAFLSSFGGIAHGRPVNQVILPEPRAHYAPQKSDTNSWREAIAALLQFAVGPESKNPDRPRDVLLIFAGPLEQPGAFWSSFEFRPHENQICDFASVEQFLTNPE